MKHEPESILLKEMLHEMPFVEPGGLFNLSVSFCMCVCVDVEHQIQTLPILLGGKAAGSRAGPQGPEMVDS